MSQKTVCDNCGSITSGRTTRLEWVLGHTSISIDLCRGQGSGDAPDGGCSGQILRAIAGESPSLRKIVEESTENESQQFRSRQHDPRDQVA